MRVLSPRQVVSLIYILGDIRDMPLRSIDRVANRTPDQQLRETAFEWFNELSQADKRHVLTLVTQKDH